MPETDSSPVISLSEDQKRVLDKLKTFADEEDAKIWVVDHDDSPHDGHVVVMERSPEFGNERVVWFMLPDGQLCPQS